MLKEGLYECVVNQEMEEEINTLQPDYIAEKKTIDKAEASKVLSAYLADIIEKSLNRLAEKRGGNSSDPISNQVDLVNKIVELVTEETKDPTIRKSSVSGQAEQLLSIISQNDDVYACSKDAAPVRPRTSLSRSTLFTGGKKELPLFEELKKEIETSDEIDMIVSFLMWTGVRLILPELRKFTSRGGRLRIISTTYMSATNVKAVVELSKLPNTEIKIDYDTQDSRLHAKTYAFYRNTGFHTAYIGSSNLSKAAVSYGLEWNLKITQQDQPETMEKIRMTFDTYWASPVFELYEESKKEKLVEALEKEKKYLENHVNYTLDVYPYPFQSEILNKLQSERRKGHTRNLVVAATGTGKTCIAAFDYMNFMKENHGTEFPRLLFVAHREEILKQSITTFRSILHDSNFGELFVGSYTPSSTNHLFISIQTFNSQNFIARKSADYYDFIIIDEFHHAAAKSYQKLLEYFEPKILLGLTATPERMDGQDILQYFDYRVAAEIRLPEAVDKGLLCPFQYFGVSDSVDLRTLKWARGGYDRRELSNVYTFSGIVAKRRAELVLKNVYDYVTDISEVKGIGFCVSKEHAKFMADFFSEHGVPSDYLVSDSGDIVRDNIKNHLVNGEIRFVFVVDIYNEGVDIPEVNTVLFLRPTESLTVFLQQLGRGLRKYPGKECLTVLDFVGQANKHYNFEEKFNALQLNAEGSLLQKIKNGYYTLPKGCAIQLEKKAQEYILENIRQQVGNTNGMLTRLLDYADLDKPITLAGFLAYYHLDARALYRVNSFSRLCVLAGLKEEFSFTEEDREFEKKMRNAFVRFSYIDSLKLIDFWMNLLKDPSILENPIPGKITDAEERMIQMFHFTIWDKEYGKLGFPDPYECIRKVRSCPFLCRELMDLLSYRFDQINYIGVPVKLNYDCPLEVHCSYTRNQLLAAMDYMNPSSMQAGVMYFPEKKIDIALVTLNKSEKDYSETTMYKDYSLGKDLFHWQTQGATSEESQTGQRYIHHVENGTDFLLFVRESKTDSVSNQAAPYLFLGKARYVQHSGSKPMNIIWKLEVPIPEWIQKKTTDLVI